MGTLRTVPKEEWRVFFDTMSKALLGKWAEIEVASLDLGDQIAAEWVPMLGITYDTADDAIDVGLDRVSHMIYHPQAIVVEEEAAGLKSVAITDADGEQQTVRMKDPLKLSAPSGRTAGA